MKLLRLGMMALVCTALFGCDLEGIPRAPEVGALAPEYYSRTLAGDSVSLSDYQGEVVVLNVWATWCIPCREEIPALQRLHDRYHEEGLRIVGVSVDARGEEAAIRSFADEFDVTFDIWYDPAQRVISTYQVIGVPNTYLIDREGIVRWKHIGPVTDDDPQLLSALESAL